MKGSTVSPAAREAMAKLLLTALLSAWVLGAYGGVAPHYSGDSTVWLESSYGADFGALLLGKRPLRSTLHRRASTQLMRQPALPGLEDQRPLLVPA